jgi:hypothetical protein
MTDFNHLRSICEKNSRISSAVIDGFLIYYAAAQDKLDKEADKLLLRYRHITKKMPKSWVNTLKSQYIAHRIFKKDGLLKKYLRHSALKKPDTEQMHFLLEQLHYSWRFSFSLITGNPARGFFNMEDILSGETFLLYSPGVADIYQTQKPLLWFNLLAFNGACWQTFGPIAYFRGFEPDDIFFFATELNPGLETEEDIIQDIEQNHIPYSMLFSGCGIPLVFTNNDQRVLLTAEYQVDRFHTAGAHFTTRKEGTVSQHKLKRWSHHPHFAIAYYDEPAKRLLLTSSTDRGFAALTQTLKQMGYAISSEADIRVNLAMLAVAEDILKKKIMPDRYAQLFEEEPEAKKQEELNRLNKFLALALPSINAGKEPDIEALAEQAGVDTATAGELLNTVISKAKKMRNR